MFFLPGPSYSPHHPPTYTRRRAGGHLAPARGTGFERLATGYSYPRRSTSPVSWGGLTTPLDGHGGAGTIHSFSSSFSGDYQQYAPVMMGDLYGQPIEHVPSGFFKEEVSPSTFFLSDELGARHSRRSPSPRTFENTLRGITFPFTGASATTLPVYAPFEALRYLDVEAGPMLYSEPLQQTDYHGGPTSMDLQAAAVAREATMPPVDQLQWPPVNHPPPLLPSPPLPASPVPPALPGRWSPPHVNVEREDDEDPGEHKDEEEQSESESEDESETQSDENEDIVVNGTDEPATKKQKAAAARKRLRKENDKKLRRGLRELKQQSRRSQVLDGNVSATTIYNAMPVTLQRKMNKVEAGAPSALTNTMSRSTKSDQFRRGKGGQALCDSDPEVVAFVQNVRKPGGSTKKEGNANSQAHKLLKQHLVQGALIHLWEKLRLHPARPQAQLQSHVSEVVHRCYRVLEMTGDKLDDKTKAEKKREEEKRKEERPRKRMKN